MISSDVTVSFTKQQSPFMEEDAQGRITSSTNLVMTVTHNSGRTLTIIKGKDIRTNSDEYSFNVGNFNQITSDRQEALSMLEKIPVISQLFGTVQAQWLPQARQFIESAVSGEVQQTTLKWDAAQETRIRQKFKDQIGALLLLESLKKLPYTDDVQSILRRLEKGAYGKWKDENRQALVGDLERRGFTQLKKLAASGSFVHKGNAEDVQAAKTIKDFNNWKKKSKL
jgi:hypothetical protein